jgi:hypothetical protein
MSAFLAVEFTDTLMRWVGEFHVQSGDRLSTFYFRVPDSWIARGDADLQGLVFGVARRMYEDLNDAFREAEPDDLGYLLVKETMARVLADEEVKAAPWLQARNPAVWEWTPCVVAGEDGAYTKVGREEFAQYAV